MDSNSINRTPPNIVMLVLDTARAGNFSCYGYERKTTPAIDALATEGVQFTRATSVSPWTLPSHASLFSGVPPSVHRTNSQNSKLPESLDTFVQVLSRNGYNTVGMSANPWLSSEFGVVRGFTTFYHLFGPFATESYREFVSELTNSTESIISRTSMLLRSQSPIDLLRNSLTASYRQFVNRDDDGAKKAVEHVGDVIGQSEPYFLFINFLEPHLPFEPPSDCRRRFVPDDVTDEQLASLNQDATAYNIRNVEMNSTDFDLLERLYDAEIYHVDRQIRRILELLDQSEQREETIVIVLGDHGENIGDHGLMAHHYSVHETLTHIPLIIRYPGVFEGGDIVDNRVSSLDVPATFIDLLADHGITDEQFETQQQGTPLHLNHSDRAIVAEYLNPMPPIERLREKSENPDFDVTRYDRHLRAIYDDNEKFVRGTDGHRALYDLSRNDSESENLVESRSARAAEHEERLDRWVEANDPEARVDATTADEQLKKRLGDLGYL